MDEKYTLTQTQIKEFIDNGVLIVPNVLTQNEIKDAINSFHQTLLKYGVDSKNLKDTAHNLNKLSTTGGAGGIIDIFYEPWRLNLASNPKIFDIVSQIWSNTFGKYKRNNKNTRNTSNTNSNNKIIHMIDNIIKYIDNGINDVIDNDLINTLYNHPFGEFDPHSGYIYMNRACFRVNDEISNYHSKGSKKKRKLQRCLAPHLDCCPHDIFGQNRDILNISHMQRWRPIQLVLSLTDNHIKNTGGFECVKGFHKKFSNYFQNKTNNNDIKDTVCVGDFCRLLPNQDKEILSAFEHIPYSAGSLIIFDWRIPHANARYNKSNDTRMVVYTGLLPNVELNRKYCQEQLKCYYQKKVPPDFWGNENYKNSKRNDNILNLQIDNTYQFSDLGQKLMTIKPW